MKNILFGALIVLILMALSALAAIQLGLPDFAADRPHGETTYELIAWARERSVAVRSARVAPPADLDDPERARRAAGNYDAMCVGCHLSPGQEEGELRRGLYPAPPDLSKPREGVRDEDARSFWIIKHGIKGSGMPAWSKGGMEDAAIWDLVAFLRVLPGLSADGYRRAVAASDGHSHRGINHSTSPHELETGPVAPPEHDHGTHDHRH